MNKTLLLENLQYILNTLESIAPGLCARFNSIIGTVENDHTLSADDIKFLSGCISFFDSLQYPGISDLIFEMITVYTDENGNVNGYIPQ